MNGRAASLVTASVAVGAGSIAAPEVPWWGELIMVLVGAALAFFGGQATRRR